MTKVVCRCGASYSENDLKEVVDHVLCDWPEQALAPSLTLDEPFACDETTMALLSTEDLKE